MKYTKEIKSQILAEYSNGIKCKELCLKYKVSKSLLYEWIKGCKVLTHKDSKTKFVISDYLGLKKKVQMQDLQIDIFKDVFDLLDIERKKKLEMAKELYDKYPVKTICKLIDLDHATFYNYLKRKVKVTQYQKHDEMLKELIVKYFNESEERFGANKIYQKLKVEGVPCSLDKIVALMKEMGLKSKRTKKQIGVNTDTPKFFYKRNLLKQNFNPEKPNMFWASDVTQIKAVENKFYICIVMDLFSRKIIAHRVSSQNNNSLTINTFKDAFENRGRPQGLIFHSDQGSNYTSFEFVSLLKFFKVAQSLSKKATPYDNSVVESFFGNLKKEDLYSRVFETFEDLVDAVNNYIEYYNNLRPHKSLNFMTPNQKDEKLN